MDMNRSWTPPDNAKILPDVYNILDAHTIRKTSTINSMLKCQLDTTQSVLRRNQCLAQRVIKEEKARVANSLNHIKTKLPAVTRIKDFDLKFFGNNTKHQHEDFSTKRAKGYQSSKNEDVVCQRCYIHHLPLKKKYYNRPPLPPLSKNRPFLHHQNPSTSTHNIAAEKGGEADYHKVTDTKEYNVSEEMEHVHQPPDSFDPGESGKRTPFSPTVSNSKQGFGWWMPSSKTYQFLKRDNIGREMDVNKHYTPRLMPYEDWKNVVHDVCSQYHKSVDGLHTI